MKCSCVTAGYCQLGQLLLVRLGAQLLGHRSEERLNRRDVALVVVDQEEEVLFDEQVYLLGQQLRSVRADLPAQPRVQLVQLRRQHEAQDVFALALHLVDEQPDLAVDRVFVLQVVGPQGLDFSRLDVLEPA